LNRREAGNRFFVVDATIGARTQERENRTGKGSFIPVAVWEQPAGAWRLT
jgi:hypothetical protein